MEALFNDVIQIMKMAFECHHSIRKGSARLCALVKDDSRCFRKERVFEVSERDVGLSGPSCISLDLTVRKDSSYCRSGEGYVDPIASSYAFTGDSLRSPHTTSTDVRASVAPNWIAGAAVSPVVPGKRMCRCQERSLWERERLVLYQDWNDLCRALRSFALAAADLTLNQSGRHCTRFPPQKLRRNNELAKVAVGSAQPVAGSHS
jgi:hypothetical protein